MGVKAADIPAYTAGYLQRGQGQGAGRPHPHRPGRDRRGRAWRRPRGADPQDRPRRQLRLQRLRRSVAASCRMEFPYGRTRSSRWTARRWSATSRPASTSRCIPSSAAWAWRPPDRTHRQRAALTPTPATWTTRSSSPAPRSTSRSRPKAPCSRPATATPGQGNGEVDITALETYLTGTFRFIVHKDRHLLWPRAETPTALHLHGLLEGPEGSHRARGARHDRLPGGRKAPDAATTPTC